MKTLVRDASATLTRAIRAGSGGPYAEAASLFLESGDKYLMALRDTPKSCLEKRNLCVLKAISSYFRAGFVYKAFQIAREFLEDDETPKDPEVTCHIILTLNENQHKRELN